MALIEAGLLVEGTWRPSMGTYCIARDGHKCNSLAEKTIDDFLSMHGVPHTREPLYPDQIHRGDFLVRDFMIEYFGLRGFEGYDATIDVKKKICKQHGLMLLAILPTDLAGAGRLEKKLGSLLEFEAESERGVNNNQARSTGIRA